MEVEARADGPVLVITLDRPKANAIDVPASRALFRAFDRLRTEPGLRVAILTGAGERFFSAGWDLKAAAGGEGIEADHGPGGFAGLTEFFEIGKPVIAAVNGLALGGGFELVLAADLVVAAEHAEFALTEVTLGLVPDAGGLLRLASRLPRPIAVEWLLTGRRIGAAEAARWGLVNRVVPVAGLMPAAFELAHAICAAAPLSVAAALEILLETEGTAVPDGYQIMRGDGLPAYRRMLDSDDAREGVRAFAERRPPRWTSRLPWLSTRATSTRQGCCAAPSSRCLVRRGCAAISSPSAQRTVAVIGSARLSPPDPRCLPAEQIGAAIAARGWTVLTGGYGGLMEVTSRAAAQAGGRVIGLPMRGWTALTPNRWNHELIWSDSYPERLGHLMAADAIVAVDGGIGTLTEAALAWSILQTEPVAADLIFLGAGWPPVLRSLADHLVIDDRDLVQVTLCADAQQVIAHIASNEPRQPRAAGPRG